MINKSNSKSNALPALLSAVLIFATISCGNPKTNGDTSTSETGQIEEIMEQKNSEEDVQFLTEVTATNLEEIQLGKLAQEKSNSAEVIALGKMLVEAHSKLLAEVTELAKAKRIAIPTELSEKALMSYKEFEQKTEKEFNADYCTKMVDGHKGAIAKFEKEIADTQDEEIKNWASTTLPVLKEHLVHSFACHKIIVQK